MYDLNTAWSECDLPCGGGSQTRLLPSTNCENLFKRETRTCNTSVCPPPQPPSPPVITSDTQPTGINSINDIITPITQSEIDSGPMTDLGTDKCYNAVYEYNHGATNHDGMSRRFILAQCSLLKFITDNSCPGLDNLELEKESCSELNIISRHVNYELSNLIYTLSNGQFTTGSFSSEITRRITDNILVSIIQELKKIIILAVYLNNNHRNSMLSMRMMPQYTPIPLTSIIDILKSHGFISPDGTIPPEVMSW